MQMTKGEFDRQTTGEPLGEGLWTAKLGDELSGFGGIHGGYIMALALRTMATLVEDGERSPRSLTCHLLAPVKPAAVELSPRLNRAGGSTTSTSLQIRQQGAIVATAQSSHGKPNPSLRHVGVTPPNAPAPTECAPLLGAVVEEARAGMLVEHRPVSPPRLLSGHESARLVVWMRLLEDRAVDALSATMLADAAVPALYATLTEPVPIPSTEITIHFADLDAARHSPWVLGVFWTTYAADGYSIEDGQLWSDDGRLILQARQLRRILGVPAKA